MGGDLTISIVNYNDRSRLATCLDSIGPASTGLAVHVCVVDNASRDGSVPFVAGRWPWVKVIANRQNRGFGSANNQVLSVLDTRYCLVTNPDVVMSPGSLVSMVRFMDSRPDAGAAGCRLLNEDGTLQYSCRRFPSPLATLCRGLCVDRLFPRSRFCRDYLMLDRDHGTAAPVDWVTGCCLMLRKATLADVGLFDESYFLYFEDVDLCYRINGRWRVYYVPEAQMLHAYRHRSRMSGDVRHAYIHLRSSVRFFSKFGLRPGDALARERRAPAAGSTGQIALPAGGVGGESGPVRATRNQPARG